MRRVILNFHGLGEPKRKLEPGEADYWISAQFFSDIVDLSIRMMDRVDTAITFDDGNLSDIEIAAPYLNAAGLRAEFFILSGRIDTAGSLGKDHLRQLQDMGHRIGNHGAGHCDWSALDGAALDSEIHDARTVLEKACDRPVSSAAIPFGRYNGQVVRALRSAGYDRAYSSDGGACQTTQFPCPRTSVTRHMDLAGVERILLGREPLKSTVRRQASMLVKRLV